MEDRTNESGIRSDEQNTVSSPSQLDVTERTADHGITITVTPHEEGVDFSWPWRASCLCGWRSSAVPSRPHAVAEREAHLTELIGGAWTARESMRPDEAEQLVSALLEATRVAR